MAAEPSKPDSSPKAREAFADFVARLGKGEKVDYQSFCAEHVEVAEELERLRETFIVEVAGLDAPVRSVSQRIRGIHGAEVDPSIVLAPEEGEDYATEIVQRLSDREKSIGRYTLMGEMARGGQGAILRVFDGDLRRHLAMKVVLGSVDGDGSSVSASDVEPKTLGRFLEEAQVTGQLDHPGIVPVHELGLDAQGRVYFTMKLVKGEDLRAIFDKVVSGADGWSRPRALNVLVKVCEAMSYAHHKRVIHRDLKPANVMVGRFGEVYVMDWGLARVLGQEDEKDIRIRSETLMTSEVQSDRRHSKSSAADSPLVTMDGDVVGTPAYMPPEQAVGDLDAMGPHSDVYSVGAMLYELVAGHMPYIRPGTRLNNYAVWYQVQDGPPHPLAQEAPEVPQELVAICEKAMARDVQDRYPDMGHMAADLSAFLEGRVVKAYETGAIAELRKWVARNKPLAAAMAAGLLALVAGLAMTLMQKKRADDNATLARESEHEARAAESMAQAEAVRASEAAATAGRISEFLVGLFEVVDPSEARGNTVTAREILDKGAARIEAELGDQPEVQSTLMETMGTVYKSLGLYDQSLELLEQSLSKRRQLYGGRHLLVSDSLDELGELFRLKADYEQAEPMLREALEMRRELHGVEHPAVAETMHELGVALAEQGRHAEATEYFVGALEMRRRFLGRHYEVARTLNELAFNRFELGDRETPEELLREALEIDQKTLGEHPETAGTLNNLAVLLSDTGRLDEALEMFRESLAMKRRVFGDIHPEVALGLNNLAFMLHDEGDLEEAAQMYREALVIQRELLGEPHPSVAQTMNNLAFVLYDNGDLDGAKAGFLGALAMWREVHGDDHPDVSGAFDNSIGFLDRYLGQLAGSVGTESPEYASVLTDKAELLVDRGAFEPAIEVAEEALMVFTEDSTNRSWQQARTESVLGGALVGLGQRDEAELLLVDAYGVLEAARGRSAPETQAALRRLVGLYEEWGREDKVREYRSVLEPPPPPNR